MKVSSNVLTPCRDCQNPCSSSANVCPKCGCNDPTGSIADQKAQDQKNGCVGCLSIFIVILSISFLLTLCQETDPNSIGEKFENLSPTMKRINRYREWVGIEKVDKPPDGVTEDQFEAIHRLDAARQGMNPDDFFH